MHFIPKKDQQLLLYKQLVLLFLLFTSLKVKVVLELDQLSVKLSKPLYDSHVRFLVEMSPHDSNPFTKLSPIFLWLIPRNIQQTHVPTVSRFG